MVIPLQDGSGDEADSNNNEQERPLRVFGPNNLTQPDNPGKRPHRTADRGTNPARFRTHRCSPDSLPESNRLVLAENVMENTFAYCARIRPIPNSEPAEKQEDPG
jgi:hypothetical protein